MFKAILRPGSKIAVDVIGQNPAKEIKILDLFLVTKNSSPLNIAFLTDGPSLLLRTQSTQLLPLLSGQAAECPGLQLLKDLCSLLGPSQCQIIGPAVCDSFRKPSASVVAALVEGNGR